MAEVDTQRIVDAITRLASVMESKNESTTGGKGRYGGSLFGYSSAFNSDKSIRDAKEMMENAKEMLKDNKNVFTHIFGLEDTMYQFRKQKAMYQDLQKEQRKLIKLKEDTKKTEEELQREGINYKKILDDIDDGVEVTAEKYGITEDTLEKIVKLHGDNVNALNKETDVINKQNNLLDSGMESVKRGFSSMIQGGKQLVNIGKQFMDAFIKVDTASANFARSIGQSGKGMASIRSNTIKMIRETSLSKDYGIGMEDILNLRSGYAGALGRNVGLSNIDIKNAAAMSVVMKENGAKMAAELENFGLSYSEAAERAGKMYKDAGKYGLSFEKYSENFLSNIKIAQNYTFKNGLRGLENMARKATALKIDMQQVANFADKVGTLQGAVETGAKLQVLGGPFAQFSDPLGMLNESMTDMEGLFDRFTKMIGNLGTFNKATGQVEISSFNRQRVKAAAEAMGMDYSQVMQTIQTSERRNFVTSQIKNRSDLTDAQKEYIANTASVSGGKANITYFDENGKSATRNVSDLSATELEKIQALTQSESADIKDIAKATRTLEQQVTGVQHKADAERAEKFEGIHKIVSKGLDLVNDNMRTIIKIMLAGQIIGAGTSLINGGGQMFSGAKTTIKGIKGANGTVEPTVAPTAETTGASIAGATGASGAGTKGAVGAGTKELLKAGAKKAFSSGILAGVLAGVFTGMDEFDKNKDYGKDSKGRSKNWKKTGRTAGSAIGAAGGTIGMAALGALLTSTGVGAALGIPLMIAGGFGGEALGKWAGGGFANQNRRARKKAEFGLEGLSGDYSVKELKAIKNGEIDEKLRTKIQANKDEGIIENALQNLSIENQTVTARGNVNIITDQQLGYGMARGGLLNGPSHAKGGIPVGNTGVEVEGGEYVVNKRSTAKNLSLLNQINSDKYGNGGVLKPRQMRDGGLLTVLTPATLGKVIGNNISTVRNNAANKPFDININGTIKLDAGNGVSVDILNTLIKDNVFVRKLTKLIEKQMVVNDKGGNVVSRGLY